MTMEMIVREADKATLMDAVGLDGQFVIDSELILQAEDNRIGYKIVDRPATTKRYDQDGVDYATGEYAGSPLLDHPERAIFLAYVDGRAAGRIALRKNWNAFGWIEDITVDVAFRGRGVGRALMDRADRWARDMGLPGLVAETQTNNVRACLFYERVGFALGGFDSYLYRGNDPATDEVAVYWYYLFEHEPQ